MSKPKVIHLLDLRGTGWVRWLRLFSNLLLLAFCIWLSHGSTWWTLVTGLLFLGVFASTVSSWSRSVRNEFHGLDELEMWIDQQRLIEAIKSRHSKVAEEDGKAS